MAGINDRPKIEKAARAVAVDGGVVVDCSGVEVMSSSYFDAAVWPLWSASELFPILSKVPPAALDDIELVLKANSGAVWHLAKGEPRLLGQLDPSLVKTLDEVAKRGEVSAGDLAEVDRAIGPTAWSNRLAALYQLRLVRRKKDGRRLNYIVSWRT
ncbi:MAG: helix-turn-helix transcriptional regulator [Deltaproteobacteria bacterium]|nr:helix-turn-helix transcriptional regulator [Deltaproteobacteria bacterium]